MYPNEFVASVLIGFEDAMDALLTGVEDCMCDALADLRERISQTREVIGTIRRECLDHVIVFGEECLRRALNSYFAYYHQWRTHLSLAKDAPQSRRTQTTTEEAVMEIAEAGGLQHHYEGRAA